MQTIVLIASPAIAIASLALNYFLYRKTQRASIMPVLVFVRIAVNQWELANVGQGPALSIVVGDKSQSGKWGNKVRYFPIAAGASVDVDSLQHCDQLVAVYADIRGNAYSSVCSASENYFSLSNEFPDLTPTIDEVTLRTMREDYQRKIGL
jgi:hypothetical protein